MRPTGCVIDMRCVGVCRIYPKPQAQPENARSSRKDRLRKAGRQGNFYEC